MLCENCNARPASIHFKSIVGNQQTERHLCESCANQLGLLYSGASGHPAQWYKAMYAAPQKETRCPRCGMTFARVQKGGRLGCAQCYQAFAPELEQLFGKIQLGVQHVGKRPGACPHGEAQQPVSPAQGDAAAQTEDSLDALRAQLQEAIAREDYECAAALRDRMRAMQGGK